MIPFQIHHFLALLSDTTGPLWEPLCVRLIKGEREKLMDWNPYLGVCMFYFYYLLLLHTRIHTSAIVSFFFSWIGYLCCACLSTTIAGRYGALSGLGLYLVFLARVSGYSLTGI